MSKIKNGGLDQYGAEPLAQQQFGTAGVEGVNVVYSVGRQQLRKCFTPVCPSEHMLTMSMSQCVKCECVLRIKYIYAYIHTYVHISKVTLHNSIGTVLPER